jgi:hypothetical protein
MRWRNGYQAYNALPAIALKCYNQRSALNFNVVVTQQCQYPARSVEKRRAIFGVNSTH